MNHDENKIQKLIQSDLSTIDIMKEYAEYIVQKEREEIEKLDYDEMYGGTEYQRGQDGYDVFNKLQEDIIHTFKGGKE